MMNEKEGLGKIIDFTSLLLGSRFLGASSEAVTELTIATSSETGNQLLLVKKGAMRSLSIGARRV